MIVDANIALKPACVIGRRGVAHTTRIRHRTSHLRADTELPRCATTRSATSTAGGSSADRRVGVSQCLAQAEAQRMKGFEDVDVQFDQPTSEPDLGASDNNPGRSDG